MLPYLGQAAGIIRAKENFYQEGHYCEDYRHRDVLIFILTLHILSRPDAL